MTRPIVLLDCDGVLADFVGDLLPIIHSVTGIRATREQITHFDFSASLGLSPAQSADVKRAIGGAVRFARFLEPCPGAIEGVAALRDLADVYIVTSPWNSNPTWTHDREWWLRKHFDIPHANVLHGSAKHLVRGDVFVDDKTDAVIAWQDAHPRSVGIRWNTPHNQLDAYDGPATGLWSVVRDIAREVRR